MQADFWHEKWAKQQIGFHQSEVNALLESHFSALELNDSARIFVPLCGKSRDIAWLLSQGYRVVAAELSELAIQQLFAELEVEPEVTSIGELTRYSAPDIDVFVGDVFALTADVLGSVDAVFDRAALVALPETMRPAYADLLAQITGAAPQFVVTFSYDQTQMAGPPFSVTADMIAALYGQKYTLTALQTDVVQGGFKGRIPATETAWLMIARG
jgi:thiopurine S-methyltransferase